MFSLLDSLGNNHPTFCHVLVARQLPLHLLAGCYASWELLLKMYCYKSDNQEIDGTSCLKSKSEEMRQIDFKWKWQQEITAMQNQPTVWARSTRSSEVELLIWNRSSWNLTHFKGRTYQAEELESSQEAGTQAWTAKCWRRLDELCTSSYSWCWRIDESFHIRLGGGTCHSFGFGSIDKLMINSSFFEMTHPHCDMLWLIK